GRGDVPCRREWLRKDHDWTTADRSPPSDGRPAPLRRQRRLAHEGSGPRAFSTRGPARAPGSLRIAESDPHGLPNALGSALPAQESEFIATGPVRGDRAAEARRPHAARELRHE